jgi:HlyD family secretion protein
MDFESYSKIKKGNGKYIGSLIDTHSKKAWFMCYYLTNKVTKAAPLFIKAFSETINGIMISETAPRVDFKTILFSNIYKFSMEEIEENEDFADTPKPQVDAKYSPFIKEFGYVSKELRSLYIMNTYAGLGVVELARVLDTSADDIRVKLKKASDDITNNRPPHDRRQGTALIILSTEFRNLSDSGYSAVQVPEFLITTLAHEINLKITINDNGNRKEASKMGNYKKTTQKTQGNMKGGAKVVTRKDDKKKKIITISAISLVVVILGVIFIPRLFGNAGTPTTITTYNVEAITTGNVDTTISGSGTLTPISKDTIATLKAGTITTLNYEVGATVEEDAVIAILTDDNGSTTEFTAPYDGVLIELPIAVDDELAANSQIAMIMGTDGFTMGIAVDELDISTVKVGQEVSFTIDAVDGYYEGLVTAVSYNGTSSGGTTAYQITAKLDFVEGVYPGMSASAEIVIESSGEGLLVPTSAIRTSGDESYIYLAPSGAEEGTEYEEDQINIDDLTKVTVETGMSDGSYTIIESDEISDGDLIVIVTLTSTQTGSDSDGQGGFGGMGGFGGGRGPGGGMDFGDFDFENFDPSGMPGGGFGGFGG